MKTILLDNIIYSLQQFGGISAMWAILQKSLLCENTMNFIFSEREDANNNVYRKDIVLSNDRLIKATYKIPLIIDRYNSINIGNTKPDIVHSSYYRSIDDRSVKKVVTVHDFTYERYMSGLRRYVHCKQKYKAICDADVVVCVSNNTRNDLLHYIPNIADDKVKVVYNGISNDFYKLDNIQRGDRLLYVGGRTKYKNFDFLIDVLSETTYSLDICGAPLSYKEQNFLNKKLGNDRYKVYSNIDNSSLNILYNRARCLIYPSSYEGFGLPIVEAQKAGCPVIALNASSIPEVIGETPLMLSNLSRKELMLLLKMVESPTLFEEISNMGVINANRFTTQAMINGYKEIYNNI